MKNKFLYGAGALVLAVIAIFFFVNRRLPDLPTPSAAAPASANDGVVASKTLTQSPERNVAQIVTQDAEDSSKSTATAPMSRPTLRVADVELDERWRKESGFPEDPFYKNYLKLSSTELKELAPKDRVAAVLYAGSLMSDPLRYETGKRLLMESAADGSIFALHELAFRSGTDQRGGSPEKQFAYWQSALALGDIGMMPILAQSAGQMSTEQYALSQVFFADVMYQLGVISSNRHGRGLLPNLRPSPSQHQGN